MALSGNFNTNKYATQSSGNIGLNLSWSGVQDIATNTTTISWTLKSNGSMSSGYCVWGGPIYVVIGGVTVYSQTSRSRIYGSGAFRKTGTVTITHEDDGTKSISMSVRAALYNSEVNCTGSANYTLDPIQRIAYAISADDFTDEDNPTITYGNPLSDVITSVQACISLDGENPTVAYRDVNISGGTYTFNLTAAERNALLAGTPNSKTCNVYYILKSVLYGDTYYSVTQRTMTVVNADPGISGAVYYDTNINTISVTLDSTKIVQALSTVKFHIDSVEAYKYATLVSVAITVNGTTYTIPLSGTEEDDIEQYIGELNVVNDLVAVIELTDSRGNKTTEEITITILPWSIPSALITLSRVNNFYTDTNLKVHSEYSSLDNHNHVTITYQTKKSTDADYGSAITIQNDTDYIISLDNAYEWNVKIIIVDDLGGTVTYCASVGKGIPIIFFDRLLRSMSVNCFPTHQNSIEVNGDIYANKVVTTGSYDSVFGPGTMTSGSQTFIDKGYSGIMIIARVTSTSSHHTRLIPKACLSDSTTQFCISDDTDYITFGLKVENGSIIVSWGGRNSSGFIKQIYGVY